MKKSNKVGILHNVYRDAYYDGNPYTLDELRRIVECGNPAQKRMAENAIKSYCYILEDEEPYGQPWYKPQYSEYQY